MIEDIEIIRGLQSNIKDRTEQEKNLYRQYDYFINEGCKKFKLLHDDSFSAYSDAILSAILNIVSNRFDGHSSLKTYLFQIFSNKCIDLVRKNTTNKQQVHQTMEIPEMLAQLPDGARTTIEKLIDQQKMVSIQAHLQLIGDKCKEILLLFEDGYTDKQIAEQLQYNTSAVAKTTRLRCLEKLKDRMAHLLNRV